MNDPAWPIFEWFLWASAIGFWWIIVACIVLIFFIRFVGRRK
jgi:hypothetical protein